MKTFTTTVTRNALAIAQGCPADTDLPGGNDLVTVTCPADYDAALIGAEDIVFDGAITVVA